jgi:hypothetical protein
MDEKVTVIPAQAPQLHPTRVAMKSTADPNATKINEYPKAFHVLTVASVLLYLVRDALLPHIRCPSTIR